MKRRNLTFSCTLVNPATVDSTNVFIQIVKNNTKHLDNTKISPRTCEVQTWRKLEGFCTHANQYSLDRAWELNPIYVLFSNLPIKKKIE